MKHLLLVALLAMTVGVSFGKVEPYKGSRIFWDMSSKTTIFPSGTYSRMIQLQDGRLLAVAEGGGVKISFSQDKGKSWSGARVIEENPDKMNYAVPDLIQLSDGTILVGFNPRPQEPYSEDRKFGIRVLRSTDNGETWSEPIFVFDAQNSFGDGCWEPAFLELPSGEVQCYFANENDYTTSNDQCISMCRSYDKGKTWSEPVKVSYRAGARDGMPVPVLLDNGEIVVIIEDNGWPGRDNFTATTVRTTLDDNWKSGYVDAASSNRDMIFETTPAVGIASAAPYMRVLGNGETIASFQGNQGRNTTDLQYYDMFVVVGDRDARNFKAQSRPFALDMTRHSIWNSLSVIDDSVVVAIGSVGTPYGGDEVMMIKGYPKAKALAAYCNSIKIDGNKSSDEKWVARNGLQLPMGNITGNQSYVDFAYDEKNLYVTARVVDRTLINTGTDNDGLCLMIDADDVCGTAPDEGMYAIFFDTDGSVKFRDCRNGAWNDYAKTDDIEYAVNIRSSYYDIEAAIPWSKLGKTGIPENRMAIAIEITDKETISLTKEVIPDVDNSASWTWLEFELMAMPTVSVNDLGVNNAGVEISKSGNALTVTSGSSNIAQVSIYSFEGILLGACAGCGRYCQIPLPCRHGGGIVLVKLKNGAVKREKILF